MTMGAGGPRQTRLAFMGHPMADKHSPIIYSRFAEQFGHRIKFEAIDVASGTFAQTVRTFHHSGGRGLNVTASYMIDAFRLADLLSARATAAGAVSVMKFEQDRIVGDNADGAALVRDLTDGFSVQIEDAHILVIGADAAVRGILGSLLEKYPAFVTVVDRTAHKAKDLADFFSARGKVRAGSFDELGDSGFDIVINAATVSLEGRAPPLPVRIFNPGALAYDLMYSERPTVFMEWARTHGAAVIADGLGTFIEQAAQCYEFWMGNRPDTRTLRDELRPRRDHAG